MQIFCSSSPPTGQSSLRAHWPAGQVVSIRRLRCRFRMMGRSKLVQLYGKALPLSEGVVAEAAQRTKGVSAAFIKELIRRVAQASIIRDGAQSVETSDISEALDDMLFTGGALNIKLLGGAQQNVGT